MIYVDIKHHGYLLTDSAIQKPDQNRNNMSHSLYNLPCALNHIQPELAGGARQ